MLKKYEKMQHIWPYGGAHRGVPPRNLHFSKLSSSWCIALIDVTLRLAVFEICAVRRPKFRPKIWDFGTLWGYRSQKGRSNF